MVESRSSRPAWVVNVPQPKQFNAEFQYNFFVKDEIVNDTGDFSDTSLHVTQLTSQTRLEDILDDRSRIPRFIKLSFVPVRVTAANRSSDPLRLKRSRPGSTSTSTVFRQHTSDALGSSNDDISIRDNIDKIVPEELFSNNAFTGIEFQDTKIDGKLYHIVSGSVASRVNSDASTKISPGPYVFNIDPAGLSFSDAANILNRLTPDSVDGELIMSALTQPDAKGARFYDEDNRKLINKTFSDIKHVSLRAQLNNRHIHKLLRYAADETTTIFCDEIRGLLPLAKSMEQRSRRDDRQWSLEQYETTLPYVALSRSSSSSVLTSRIIGYIIDKYEIVGGASRTFVKRDPIIIENDAASTAVDLAVRYNTEYVYTIRAIAAIEVPAIANDVNTRVYTATVLVSSRPSPQVRLKTVEDVAPPPPADYSVMWDFDETAPRLIWNFPVNPQRDIKKFQVFKRRNVNEPFQLIRMFDFNDAQPSLPDRENPASQLVEYSSQPVLSFVDKSFDVNNQAIYAVCSVDAHGLTSNYSMQFLVGFDRFANSLKTTVISFSGAPKQYPNLFLKQDVFLDAIRDSGHTHVKIAFDPEFVSLYDENGSDVSFMSTKDEGAKYRLQLINIDFQRQQDIDVAISDRRSPAAIRSTFRKRRTRALKDSRFVGTKKDGAANMIQLKPSGAPAPPGSRK